MTPVVPAPAAFVDVRVDLTFSEAVADHRAMLAAKREARAAEHVAGLIAKWKAEDKVDRRTGLADRRTGLERRVALPDDATWLESIDKRRRAADSNRFTGDGTSAWAALS